MYEITVTHTIDAAHRVVGHEGGKGKCARLHGHSYEFEVALAGESLSPTGFVVDFGEVKRALDEWDHRTVLWADDPLIIGIGEGRAQPVLDRGFFGAGWGAQPDPHGETVIGLVRVPFNPTAENMARYFAERFAVLAGVEFARVTVRETAKTSATWTT